MKVLIAEDYESANISIQKTLQELGIPDPDYVYYCDDALQKIQIAIRQSQSYDLLITDLYFDQDHREQKIQGGEALIAAVRKEQPDLKILVFSATGKAAVINTLFNKLDIDGYVSKGRNDAKELTKAMESISRNQRYVPTQLLRQAKQKNAHEFADIDIAIITQLTQGKRQQEIADYLLQNNIQPAGKSSIEKRLKLMKEAFDFSTNEQLIAHCIKTGII